VGRAAVPAGRGTSHPAYLRATTDLDPEELRHEGGDRDRLGVKSGGEQMAVGPKKETRLFASASRSEKPCFFAQAGSDLAGPGNQETE
jgi:hypothetical protein